MKEQCVLVREVSLPVSLHGMLLELTVPSLHTLRHNAVWRFSSRVSKSCNTLVRTVDKFCVALAGYIVLFLC